MARRVCAVPGLLVLGGLGGMAVSGGIASVSHHAGQNDYCATCRYGAWPRATYEERSHFKNASAVRAQCGSCHEAQHPWWKLLWQKARYGTRIHNRKGGPLGPSWAIRERFCRSCPPFNVRFTPKSTE